ncbi:MAG TPA: transcriptional regulator [Terriglobales bacterium]
MSVFFFSTLVWAAQWTVLGPDGGDVRSLTYDPQHPDRIFLGTGTGTVFLSTDGGRRWTRFARVGGDDYVLDHILVDPQNAHRIFIGAWSVESQQSGDVFRSIDSGKTWQPLAAMHGKSVRALSMAPSDSKVLVAGALDGVFRSRDGGDSWERISPPNHRDIKNIESIAIDPKDPNVIYAGTWHLAWKTSDGGATWRQINKGMIDDSDVFSVIVDASNPSVVFASACSGIYKSETAGELFRKIQGIPFSARRTRVLKQDPGNLSIVYAGTTEGLWKSSDMGKTWRRVTGPEVVVNDVLVDPRNSRRVLLASDRSGVLASEDGALTFNASNHGYTHRYVTSIASDKNDPGVIHVGVVNDREWGGVFASRDGGLHWQQKSTGLGGRDVFALKRTASGQLIAGTNKGIFLLARDSETWQPINRVVNEKNLARTVVKGKKKVAVTTKKVSRSVLDSRVYELEIVPQRWLAATAAGLFTSVNEGKTWSGGPILGKNEIIAVKANGELLVAATRLHVLISRDGGATWRQTSPASYINSIRGVTLTPEGHILVAAGEGAFRTVDSGAIWEHAVNGLPDKNISSITSDEAANRLLATSSATGIIFESRDGGKSWRRGPDSGYPLRRVSVVGGRLLAATPFDGVIAQPEGQSESVSAGLGGSSN